MLVVLFVQLKITRNSVRNKTRIQTEDIHGILESASRPHLGTVSGATKRGRERSLAPSPDSQ
jgi:hypothetical protein